MERYRLDRQPLVGTPSSTIYLGTDVMTRERLAVKVLNRSTSSVERRKQRLLHGAHVLLRVSPHPGIVGVRDICDVEGKLYIVMEYVSGGTLLDYIARRGPLREADAVVVVRQLLQALLHLHSFGIMHRDLKAENILIESSTGCSRTSLGRVYICDYGFATDAVPSSECVGSPHYCAPEIAHVGLMQQANTTAGGSSYNEKCDLWSLGVLVYAMLSGMLPFDGSTPTEVFRSILSGSISFTQPVWHCISDAARHFVLFILARDPAKRPTALQSLEHQWLKM